MRLSLGLQGLSVLAFSFAFHSSSLSQTLPTPLTPEEAIKQANRSVDQIVAIPKGDRTFNNTVLALDDLTDLLNTQTALQVFMEQVSPNSAVRDRAREADEEITDWQNALLKRVD